jgi:hypothetical protein
MVETVHKTFGECVSEINELETQKKEMAPQPPSEEFGKPIEMFVTGYKETLAELNRLWLVKKLSRKLR